MDSSFSQSLVFDNEALLRDDIYSNIYNGAACPEVTLSGSINASTAEQKLYREDGLEEVMTMG